MADDSTDDLEQQLRPLRERIDSLDDELVRLLNERARVAVDIGRTKRDAAGGSGGTASFYVPSRERAVFEKIRGLNARAFAGPHARCGVA